jgi:RNA polymerase sigma factor (sigma-70 family)
VSITSSPISVAPTIPLDQLLRQAQPRLTRIARSYRICADAADDIVQETCIHAWRHLEQIRSADRFDAWLGAICRNQCRMYLRTQQAARRHITPPLWSARPSTGDASRVADVADPLAHEGWPLRAALAAEPCDDPYDEVERRELAELLDRALRCLPAQTRTALELRYLHGFSLAEVAAALDTDVVAQEARLRRARARLRTTLLGPLRHDAAAFGLAPDSDDTDERQATWQTTRMTCYLCGQRPLEGRFEPLPDRRRELRLRCPVCSPRLDADVFRSKGLAPLDHLRAFRPALTRSMRALDAHARRTLASGRDVCLHCGSPVRREVVTPDAFPDALAHSPWRHWLVAPCPRAGCPGLGAWAAAAPALWSDVDARRFMARHPHWVLAPEEDAIWQGRPAILVRMVERSGAARLTLPLDRATLRVLAACQV